MNRKQIYRQISAILEANTLEWTETPSGGMFLRFSSAGVSIELTSWGTQTLIQISSDVLSEIEESTQLVLEEVNGLNIASRFARWVYYAKSRTVSVEYDLLGDHLQENELLTGLAALARLADFQDDQLQQKLRGRKAFEA